MSCWPQHKQGEALLRRPPLVRHLDAAVLVRLLRGVRAVLLWRGPGRAAHALEDCLLLHTGLPTSDWPTSISCRHDVAATVGKDNARHMMSGPAPTQVVMAPKLQIDQADQRLQLVAGIRHRTS